MADISVEFNKSKTLASAVADSSSTNGTIYFPTDSTSLVLFGKKYGVNGAYSESSGSLADKMASYTGYTLRKNNFFILTLTQSNTIKTQLSLNIEGTGKKTLYINGSISSSTNYTLPAGTYPCSYDGNYYYVRTDGYLQGNVVGYLSGTAANADTVDNLHASSFVRQWNGVYGSANKVCTFSRNEEKSWISLEVWTSTNGSVASFGIYRIGWGYDATNTEKSISVTCICTNITNYAKALRAVRKESGKNVFDLYFTFDAAAANVSYREMHGTNATIVNYDTSAVTSVPDSSYISSLSSVYLNTTGNAATATNATNADKLDGYHASSFLQLSGGTMSGALNMGGNDLILSTDTSWTDKDRGVPFSTTSGSKYIRYYSDDASKGFTFNPGTGAVKAGSFVKRGGTSSQFLKADGTVDNNSYSTTDHTHSYIKVGGDRKLDTSTFTNERLFANSYYNSNGPSNYGNLIEVTYRNGGSQLALSWSGSQTKSDGTDTNVGRLYYRSKRDCIAGWTVWNTVAWTSDIPTALKNPKTLAIQLNDGTVEGTSLFTYDGSSKKEINITPSNIGAATSGHNHDSSYLKLSGGTMSGVITLTSGAPAAYNKTALSFTSSDGKTEQGRIGTDKNGGLGIYGYGSIYLRPGCTDLANNNSSGKGLAIGTNSLQYNGTNVSLSGHTHSYLPLSGGTMIGKITTHNKNGIAFPLQTTSGSRASYFTDADSHIHGGEDGASYDGTNIQIGTWYGFGIYPTIGNQTRTQGKNSFWHNARTGNTYTVGNYYQVSFDASNNLVYTPVSTVGHTHTFASITDKIVYGNEFNFIPNEFNSELWLNYLPSDDRNKKAAISTYIFGNGSAEYAQVKAKTFYNSNGTEVSYNGHNHNSLYVTEVNTSGNYLTYKKNGTTVNLSIPNSDKLDGYHLTETAKAFYTNSVSDTSTGDKWYIVKLPNWHGNIDQIEIVSDGYNNYGRAVVYIGSMNNMIWGYQSSYNGIAFDGITTYFDDQGISGIWIHIPKDKTKLIVYGTVTLTLTSANAPESYKTVTSGMFSLQNINADITGISTGNLTSISYDSTTKKLKQTKNGTTTDVVTFGSNAFNSTSYLPLIGGTVTGDVTFKKNVTFHSLNEMSFNNGDDVSTNLKKLLDDKADSSAIITVTTQGQALYFIRGNSDNYGITPPYATNADTVDNYHASGLLTGITNTNNGISISVGGTTKSVNNITSYNAINFGRQTWLYYSYTRDTSVYTAGHYIKIATTSIKAITWVGRSLILDIYSNYYQSKGPYVGRVEISIQHGSSTTDLTNKLQVKNKWVFRNANYDDNIKVITVKDIPNKNVDVYLYHGFFDEQLSILATNNGFTLNTSNSKDTTIPVAVDGSVILYESTDAVYVGNVSTATQLKTARTLTIGKTGKSFDGSADVSWSLSEIGAAESEHTHTQLNTAFNFLNKDISEDVGNLQSTATKHSINFYRNGFTIPYQVDNTCDGGMFRVRGTSESNTVCEIATWDDSGTGETIQFNYYPTTSRATPTYSVAVPKKSGTIALTSDIPTTLKNPKTLDIQFNDGGTIGKDLFIYDGSTNVNINITPENINAVPLNSKNQIDSKYLPSYVDDVLEYDSSTDFPKAPDSPESGKIYVDTSTNLTYRWSGTQYIEISKSLALGETSSTAYYGDKGKVAYTHSQITSGNPHKVTKSDVGLGSVENKSSATIRAELTKANVTTALGYTPLKDHQSLDGRAIVKKLTNENLNDVTFPGFYNSGGNNGATNKPSGVSAFGLNVTHDASGSYYTQILFDGEVSDKTYIRHCNGGTWTAWKYINTSDVAGVGGTYQPIYIDSSGNTVTGTSYANAITTVQQQGNALYFTRINGDGGGITPKYAENAGNADKLDNKHWTNIKIGGRNYFKQSSGCSGITKDTTINGGYIALEAGKQLRISEIGINGIVSDWTVSFYIKASEDTSCNIDMCDISPDMSYNEKNPISVTTSYVKHAFTFLNVNKYHNSSAYNGFIDISTTNAATIYLKDIMIERGTIATDWVLAPEDGASKLTTSKTIWGKSFDGTSNISGDLTGVGNINTSGSPVGTIYASNWFRSIGTTGWYSETYGGGWYMSDTSWIRNWGSKAVYLNANLCVGNNAKIGIGTTSPSYTLDASGTSRIQKHLILDAGTKELGTQWDGGLIAGKDGHTKVVASYLASSTNAATIGAHTSNLDDWGKLNIAGTNLQFSIKESPKMYLDSSGNFGIGTTIPTHKLHVDGDGYLTNTLHINPTNATGSYDEGIRVYAKNNWSTIMLNGSDNTAMSGTSANSWIFGNNNGNLYINKASSSTQKANRLWGHSNGWTLGNTSVTSYALNVGGTTYTSKLLAVNTQNSITVGANGNDDSYLNSLSHQLIVTGTSSNGTIRFGTTSWDWNQWAGLKYTHSNKTIDFGIADGTVFTANNVQTDGSLNLVNIKNLHTQADFNITGATKITSSAGLEITNVISGESYATSEGYYTSAHNNIILRGDATYGKSGILFTSSKGTTSINQQSDKGFIQFQPYGGTSTSGESNKLVIGVGNDADDMVYLQTPSITGLRHAVGTSTYVIPANGNNTDGILARSGNLQYAYIPSHPAATSTNKTAYSAYQVLKVRAKSTWDASNSKSVSSGYEYALSNYIDNAGNADTLDGYHAIDVNQSWYTLCGGASTTNVINWYKLSSITSTKGDNIDNDWMIEIYSYGDQNYTSHIHGYLRCTSYSTVSTSIVLSTDPFATSNNFNLYATIDSSRNVWLGVQAAFTCKTCFRILQKSSVNPVVTSGWTTQTTTPNTKYITRNGSLKNYNGTVQKLNLNNVNVDYATNANYANSTYSSTTCTGNAATSTASSSLKLLSSTRQSSLNYNTSNSSYLGKVTYSLATSTAKTGKPPVDSGVLTMAWDNKGWASQIAVTSDNNPRIYTRGATSDSSGNSSWDASWNTVAYTSDIPTTLKNPNSFVIQANGKEVASYDGSNKITLNVTPSGIGAASSSHTHSYLPLSGGTITSSNFAPFTIIRSGSTNASAINFSNSNGTLGYIGMTGAANGQLKRWNTNTSLSYDILDSSSTYVSSTGIIKINGVNPISNLQEGTSNVTDGTMFITSYATNNGFADTNAPNVPYKRKASCLYNYIKGKTDSLYATKSHSHSYLPLNGGTETGVIYSSYKSGTWVNSLTKSAISLNDLAGSYGGWICGPTKNGRIAISTYQANDDYLYFGYGERGRTENSFKTQMYWDASNNIMYAGTFKRLSDAKEVSYSGHNHDGRYVYNYGGTDCKDASRGDNYMGMTTSSGIDSNWWHIINAGWNGEYRWNSQIGFPTQDRSAMYFRSGKDDNSGWGSWKRLALYSEIPSIPSSIKNPNSLVVQLNDGTVEGTSLFTYDGSSKKEINITPSNIGASAANHTHTISLASDGGTSNITLSHGSKYKLTAGGKSLIFTTPSDNAHTIDNWLLDNIVTTGYITSSTANLSNYWAKMWDVTLGGYQYNDITVTLLISANYSPSYHGIITVGLRQNGKINSHAYNIGASLKEVVGNIPSSAFRLYYDNSTGYCQLWGNTGGQYATINTSILKKCYRIEKDTANIGVLYSTDFTTTQTLPDSSYVSLSYQTTYTGVLKTTGQLNIVPNSSSYSYNEGIRINTASNGWTSIMLKGTDNNSDSGTSENSWSIHTNNGNFYINKNGSNTQKATRIWAHNNGLTIGNTSTSTYALNVGGSTYADKFIVKNGTSSQFLKGDGTLDSTTYRSNTSPVSGKWFNGTPLVGSDGVSELGKYLDLHHANTSTLDFSVRLICPEVERGISINLPKSGGTLALTSDINIPSTVSSFQNDAGYTTNKGTVTSVAVKMNNSEKGTITSSGTIDLGTVITSKSDCFKWYGNANQSNMNGVARLEKSTGMTNLGSAGNSVDNPHNGSTESTGWHLYFNTCYSDGGAGSNAWVAQIANRAGTDNWYVRSRSGGTVTDGTAWTSPWRHIVTSNNTSVGSSTKPVYINQCGEVVACEYTIEKSVPSNAVFTDTKYTHPTYTSKSSGLYKITVDGTGHVSATAAVKKSDITALGIPSQDTDTHYTSKNVVAKDSSTVYDTSSLITNGNVYLNHIENGSISSSHKISGSDGTTVTADASSNIIITSVPTKVGVSTLKIYPSTNEINFGGTSTNKSIYFGYTSKDNRPVPTEYVFGGRNNVYATLRAGGYKKYGGTSKQFLKADGTVDSNTYLTATSVVPMIVGEITGWNDDVNEATFAVTKKQGISDMMSVPAGTVFMIMNPCSTTCNTIDYITDDDSGAEYYFWTSPTVTGGGGTLLAVSLAGGNGDLFVFSAT